MMQTNSTTQQRSLNTRQAILEATLDCIDQWGYHRTSTNKIIEHAGVSRGALLHHYPTKTELISAAFAYLHELVTAEVSAIVGRAENNKKAWPQLLDEIMGSTFQGRLWDVFLEIMVASRTDQDLWQELIPTTKHYYESVDTVWHQHFTADQPNPEHSEKVTTLLNLSMCVLRGLAVQRLLRDEPQYYNNVIGLWKGMLDEHEIQSDSE